MSNSSDDAMEAMKTSPDKQGRYRDLNAETEYIRSPDKWPQWPFLPMKGPERYEVGLIIETNEPDWQKTIYLANLFSGEKIAKAMTDPKQQVKFETIADMLEAGWRID